jgi:hypothetical protein
MAMRIKTMLVILVFCNVVVPLVYSQTYFIHTYGEEIDSNGNRNVLIKSIDINQAVILDSFSIYNEGFVLFKKPAQVSVNNQNTFVSVIQKGGYNKNCSNMYHAVVISIVNNNNFFSLVRRDSIPNAILGIFKQYADESSFRLKVFQRNDKLHIIPSGDYTLDNDYQFRKLRNYDPHLSPGGIRRIGSFEYLNRLNLPNTHHLFSTIGRDTRFWILRLDLNQNLVDSLMIENCEQCSKIFAYHPLRDKLYIFHLNYEAHGKDPEYDRNYGQDWITPEVLVYNPSTLQLLERHELTDFDSANYPGNERGLADVVGDYIVYYFFEDDWMGRFNPAMLFIFDTRTNEARWLRVGWR